MQDSYAKLKYDAPKEQDEIRYLEEPYVPHALVGAMTQNKLRVQGKNMYGLSATGKSDRKKCEIQEVIKMEQEEGRIA